MNFEKIPQEEGEDKKDKEKNVFTKKERERLIRDSRLKELRELKRSGGIHPNDI